MNFRYYLMMVIVALAAACTQRTDTPPTNRDGIAGGSNTPPPKQETPAPQPGKGEERMPVEPILDDLEERPILGDNEFTVLAGSFSRREQAEELAFSLRMQRINNFIDHVGGEWFVCVGQYGSSRGARNTLRLVRQKGFSDAVIYGPGHAL